MKRANAPVSAAQVAERVAAIIAMDGWLSITEAATYGNMNRQVLERLARKKKIQRGRHGRDYRFKARWIDNYLMRKGFDGRGGQQ